MSEEKRIYVVVPETIQTTRVNWASEVRETITESIPMVPGRLMAQCAHVVSKMWAHFVYSDWEPTTTIVLSVRNSKALNKVLNEFRHGGFEFNVHEFLDTNSEVYGTSAPQLTAICTDPITQEERDGVEHIIGHLELYGA